MMPPSPITQSGIVALSDTKYKDSVKDIIGYAVIYQELHDQYENDFGVDNGI